MFRDIPVEVFALNDELELAERAGLGLKEYAKVAKIKYLLQKVAKKTTIWSKYIINLLIFSK